MSVWAGTGGWRGRRAGLEELPHVLVERLLRRGVHEVQAKLVDHHDFDPRPLSPTIGAGVLLDLAAPRAGQRRSRQRQRIGATAAPAGDRGGSGQLTNLSGKHDPALGPLEDFMRQAHEKDEIAIIGLGGATAQGLHELVRHRHLT
jgi:hypothetical protein